MGPGHGILSGPWNLTWWLSLSPLRHFDSNWKIYTDFRTSSNSLIGCRHRNCRLHHSLRLSELTKCKYCVPVESTNRISSTQPRHISNVSFLTSSRLGMWNPGLDLMQFFKSVWKICPPKRRESNEQVLTLRLWCEGDMFQMSLYFPPKKRCWWTIQKDLMKQNSLRILYCL